MFRRKSSLNSNCSELGHIFLSASQLFSSAGIFNAVTATLLISRLLSSLRLNGIPADPKWQPVSTGAWYYQSFRSSCSSCYITRICIPFRTDGIRYRCAVKIMMSFSKTELKREKLSWSAFNVLGGRINLGLSCTGERVLFIFKQICLERLVRRFENYRSSTCIMSTELWNDFQLVDLLCFGQMCKQALCWIICHYNFVKSCHIERCVFSLFCVKWF